MFYILTFLVKSSPSKIFRPEAKKSVFASAFQRPGSKCASVGAPNLAPFPTLALVKR
jgi:hypothetical protein